jgi:hypothetical protein
MQHAGSRNPEEEREQQMHRVKAIWEKVSSEPVAVRAVVLSVINIAVLTGLVDASFAGDAQPIIDAVFLLVTNISLVLSARSKVSPAPRPA